jgi:hypothetical protein
MTIDPIKKQRKINDLELAVRTIDDMLPEMSTPALQKWQGILRTALLRVEKELTATSLHTCVLCFCQEWGYRDDIPASWYKKGNAEICFNHEYAEAEKELKAMKRDTDAFFPPEIPAPTVEGLKVMMNNLPPAKTETDHTYEELLAEL